MLAFLLVLSGSARLATLLLVLGVKTWFQLLVCLLSIRPLPPDDDVPLLAAIQALLEKRDQERDTRDKLREERAAAERQQLQAQIKDLADGQAASTSNTGALLILPGAVRLCV